ncbi:hypothetical protein THAOC_36414, partial [Thalassiosira oceanica]
AATLPVSAVRLGSRLGVFILLNAKGFLLRVLRQRDQLDLAGIVHARVIVVVNRHSVRDTKAIDILPDLSRFGSVCVEFRPDRPRRARSSSGSMTPVPRLYDSAKGFRMCTQCSTSRVKMERTRILLWKRVGIGVDDVEVNETRYYDMWNERSRSADTAGSVSTCGYPQAAGYLSVS